MTATPESTHAPQWAGYVEQVQALLRSFAASQGPAIEAVADRLQESLARGGIVHIFGSGHSQIAAQEIFRRAGGLVAVNPILDGNLSFYGTVVSDRLERLEGYAEILLAEQTFRPGEICIVVSNSGLNPVPIEVAQIAQQRDCHVVAVTSARNYADVPSRHSSGTRLADVADTVIDTGTPIGDAAVEVPGFKAKVGATSTVLASVALQAIVIEAISRATARGNPPQVFASVNLPGGDDRNAGLIESARPHPGSGR